MAVYTGAVTVTNPLLSAPAKTAATARSSFAIPPTSTSTATRPPLASSGKQWPR